MEAVVEYDGILIEQLPGGPRLVLFSAPAREIERWSGIPQRRRVAGQFETAGFQREQKRKRVKDLASFMAEPQNVIQNPLLAAVQDNTLVSVSSNTVGPCKIKIAMSDIYAMSLADLLARAMAELEKRLSELTGRAVDQEIVARLRQELSISSPEYGSVENDDEALDESSLAAASDFEDQEVDPGVALDEESQVLDFYDQLKARQLVLQELGKDGSDLDWIGGFSRDFLYSLVKPVVLVDGQHRLAGALQAIEDFATSEEGTDLQANLIDQGFDPEKAELHIGVTQGRRLPVSLLLDPNPAEHVFQFVVVNQKATPMSNALLGTIVSTSLTQQEMDPIRQRLSSAGIELEGSRAISYMRRAINSPFRGLVSTGIAGDQPNALPWTVLGGLIRVVRYLEGGEPYHPPKVDFAKLWRANGFDGSDLVELRLDPGERLAVWSALDGPWREFFIRLHTKIRDKFGNMDDPEASNYWGSTRSNLFNMVTLRILTADFFSFIQGRAFDTWGDLDNALEEWIGDLNEQYFARDWRMGGTKKDQPSIKEAWSSTWAEYRLLRDRLPRVEKYNPGGRRVGN